MKDCVALYGNTAYKLDSFNVKIPKCNVNPKYRMPFCHQSVFVRTDVLKAYKFDTNFKICADNDFFTKLYNQGYTFYHSKEIISLYDANGLSSKPSWQFFKEELIIICKYNHFYVFIFIPRYIFIILKYMIKSILPKEISIAIQKKYNAK